MMSADPGSGRLAPPASGNEAVAVPQPKLADAGADVAQTPLRLHDRSWHRYVRKRIQLMDFDGSRFSSAIFAGRSRCAEVRWSERWRGSRDARQCWDEWSAVRGDAQDTPTSRDDLVGLMQERFAPEADGAKLAATVDKVLRLLGAAGVRDGEHFMNEFLPLFILATAQPLEFAAIKSPMAQPAGASMASKRFEISYSPTEATGAARALFPAADDEAAAAPAAPAAPAAAADATEPSVRAASPSCEHSHSLAHNGASRGSEDALSVEAEASTAAAAAAESADTTEGEEKVDDWLEGMGLWPAAAAAAAMAAATADGTARSDDAADATDATDATPAAGSGSTSVPLHNGDVPSSVGASAAASAAAPAAVDGPPLSPATGGHLSAPSTCRHTPTQSASCSAAAAGAGASCSGGEDDITAFEASSSAAETAAEEQRSTASSATTLSASSAGSAAVAREAALRLERGPTDRYGFLRTDSRYNMVSATDGPLSQRKRLWLENSRLQKWRHMLRDWPEFRVRHADRFKQRVRKGVPDALRGHVWGLLASSDSKRRQPNLYQQLLRSTAASTNPHTRPEGTIDRDLNRTFPRQQLFSAKGGMGQSLLRNVLVAYAMYDTSVGYCQGMNFFVGLLLCYMTEEDAFWVLVSLMSDPPYRMAAMFESGLIAVHRCLFQLRGLIRRFLPRLSAHFDRHSVDVTWFASEWFLTVFTRSFPFDMVVRVWDVFLAEGWKIVFRVALAILQLSQSTLLRQDMEGMMEHFRVLPRSLDSRVVLKAALKLRLRTKHLQDLEEEFVRQQARGAQ